MCGGGGGTKKPAAPVNMGYTYTPSDTSNQRQQALAVAPNGNQSTSYGSELGTPAPAAAPANGGQ